MYNRIGYTFSYDVWFVDDVTIHKDGKDINKSIPKLSKML